jgi:hypothetical protein
VNRIHASLLRDATGYGRHFRGLRSSESRELIHEGVAIANCIQVTADDRRKLLHGLW